MILGIDYGDKRVGLALAEAGSMAAAFKVLANNSREELLSELKNIIEQENIDKVVVGLPYSLSGEVNERLNITKEFVDYLKKNLGIEIFTVDERLTSKMFTKLGVKKDIDEHSAAAILDTFLKQNDN